MRFTGEQRKQFHDVVWDIYEWIEDDDERFEAFGEFQADFFGAIDLPPGELSTSEMLNALGEEAQSFIGAGLVEEFIRSGDYPVADEYLDESELPELSKEFVRALQRCERSFYEVAEVKPGVSITLRDLIRPLDPVTVYDEDAANALVRWDVIFGRISDVRGELVISPLSLPMDQLTAGEAAGFIRDVQRQAAEAVSDEEAWQEATWNAAPIATVSYIKALYSEQQLQLTDEVVFRYQLRISAKEMAAKLSKLKEFVAGDEPDFWFWKTGHNPNDPPNAAIFIERDGLFVAGSSNKKVKAAVAKIEKDLRLKLGKGELVEEDDEQEGLFDEDERTPEEILAAVRAQLDEPLDDTDGMTIRQMAKIPQMKPMVEAMLKQTEHQMKELGHDSPGLDFSEIWKDLGLKYPTGPE